MSDHLEWDEQAELGRGYKQVTPVRLLMGRKETVTYKHPGSVLGSRLSPASGQCSQSPPQTIYPNIIQCPISTVCASFLAQGHFFIHKHPHHIFPLEALNLFIGEKQFRNCLS